MGLGSQAPRAGRIEADIDDSGWRSPHFPFIAHIGEYADALSSLLDVDSAISTRRDAHGPAEDTRQMRLVGETGCHCYFAQRVAESDHARRQAGASLPLIGMRRHAGRPLKRAQ